MPVVTLLGVEFISFCDLAKGSGVSAAKLHKAVSDAGLDIRKFGRTFFVKKAEFEKWLEGRDGQQAMERQRKLENQ